MYWLSEELAFPHPKYAEPDGLLAVGGDLSIERILLAYENGIFPWYNPQDPILWWSPDPRFIIYPHKIHVSKNMRKLMRRQTFDIHYDSAFEQVIDACASIPRKGQDGTWLTPEMKAAYIKLHQLGLAHSVEAWQKGQLVGGLYGLSLGKCFFGESMFAKVSNASKATLIHLAKTLEKQDFRLIDCQIYTKHLESMGGESIDRTAFLEVLNANKEDATLKGAWTDFSRPLF